MSDGPSKFGPQGAEPLDDIILGDDESVAAPPPVAPKPSSPVLHRPSQGPVSPSGHYPAEGPSRSSDHIKVASEAGREGKEAQGRKRAKMTLRIPDDEVSRPNLPSSTPAGGIPIVQNVERLIASPREPLPAEPAARADDDDVVAFTRTGPPSAFNPEDTLKLPVDDVRARLAAIAGESTTLKSSPAVGIDRASDPGWTPFQPPVEENFAPILPSPIVEISGPSNGGGGHDLRGTMLDPHEFSLPIDPRESELFHDDRLTSSPSSEDIPVDMDLSGIGSVPDASSEELATHPRLPLDSEEIRLEEGDRVSENGEVEVEPEDLVSVESLPLPSQQPPPVKTAGKYPIFKGSESTTPPPEAVDTTSRPQVPPSTLSSQPPAALQVSAGPRSWDDGGASGAMGPHFPSTHPSGGPPAATSTSVSTRPLAQGSVGPASAPAQKASNPLVFVPPVGALAPPPMTDAIATRKKTRPWWEELFNDDFIRTMAKVTDEQIGKEVNFIEESLGCEAGAMILDLACGTGRHAVELAARGYQVVGFDLSLAMLARASDEAQDRKQKINFVQGDMREMTFEETFDGVYSWNTSFGYFDEEKNGAVIARVHKALKKGGQFLLDVVNRDYIVRQAPSLAWFEGDGCICMDEMTIDFITSRMKVKRTLMMDDGRTKEIEYSIRTYALHELGKMLHDNGFRVAEVSGRTGTPGVFFGCESPRTLILAEKR